MNKEVGQFNVEDLGYIYYGQNVFKTIKLIKFNKDNQEVGNKVLYFYIAPKGYENNINYRARYIIPAFDNEKIVRYWYNKKNYSRYICTRFNNNKGVIETKIELFID